MSNIPVFGVNGILGQVEGTSGLQDVVTTRKNIHARIESIAIVAQGGAGEASLHAVEDGEVGDSSNIILSTGSISSGGSFTGTIPVITLRDGQTLVANTTTANLVITAFGQKGSISGVA